MEQEWAAYSFNYPLVWYYTWILNVSQELTNKTFVLMDKAFMSQWLKIVYLHVKVEIDASANNSKHVHLVIPATIYSISDRVSKLEICMNKAKNTL